ncbi:hypothetical protein MY11210_002198 [Beauveria gryllotalpidicola]
MKALIDGNKAIKTAASGTRREKGYKYPVATDEFARTVARYNAALQAARANPRARFSRLFSCALLRIAPSISHSGLATCPQRVRIPLLRRRVAVVALGPMATSRPRRSVDGILVVGDSDDEIYGPEYEENFPCLTCLGSAIKNIRLNCVPTASGSCYNKST